MPINRGSARILRRQSSRVRSLHIPSHQVLGLNGPSLWVTVLKISRHATQDCLVITIRTICRLVVGALNQQGQRVIGTLEMPDLSLVGLDDHYWVTSPSRRWSVFVANRVGEIQRLTKIKHWHHVASSNNPTDIFARAKSLRLDQCWEVVEWPRISKMGWKTLAAQCLHAFGQRFSRTKENPRSHFHFPSLYRRRLAK